MRTIHYLGQSIGIDENNTFIVGVKVGVANFFFVNR